MNSLEEGNNMTEQTEATPFQAKREEIAQSNAYGVEPPRCVTCNELLSNLNPFQVVKYCGKACRMAKSKRGQKKLLVRMRKNGIVK